MPAFRHARLPACRHARDPVLQCSGVATFRPALRCCGVAAFEKKCVDGSVAGSAWRRVPPTGLRLHTTRFRRGGTSVCEFAYSRAAVPTMARRQACVVCVSGCSGIPVASQGPWWAGGKSSGTRFFFHGVVPLVIRTSRLTSHPSRVSCGSGVRLLRGRCPRRRPPGSHDGGAVGRPLARFATAAFAVASSIRVGLG